MMLLNQAPTPDDQSSGTSIQTVLSLLRNTKLVQYACVLTTTTAAYCICDPVVASIFSIGLSSDFQDYKEGCLSESAQKSLFFQKELVRRTPPNIEFMVSEPRSSDNHVPGNRPEWFRI